MKFYLPNKLDPEVVNCTTIVLKSALLSDVLGRISQVTGLSEWLAQFSSSLMNTLRSKSYKDW